MKQNLKSLIFFLLITGAAHYCCAQEHVSGQHRPISEAELKQKIFSAGRGEAVHIDLIAPAEKKEQPAEINTIKRQSAIANHPDQPASAGRKNKMLKKQNSAKNTLQLNDYKFKFET